MKLEILGRLHIRFLHYVNLISYLLVCRFGKVVCCEVIRDKKTGDSLQYAFVEFENQEACEQVRGN